VIHVVELGVVVDVDLDDGRTFAFGSEVKPDVGRPRGPLLCWFADEDELVWFKVRAPRLQPITPMVQESEAARLRRRWTRGREPATMRVFADVPITGPRARVGKATAIRYHSDKWNNRGAWVLYRHEFGPGVELFIREGSATTHMLAGGRLRITSDGIEG